MDNHSQSLSNSSWENPFGLSGSIGHCNLESSEQFVGEELKAFFDKEEKMYQSASSVKSDQSHQTEKSNAMVSGISLRSFMVDSGDSDLIHQKLTMSQYLAYKSEPMGPELGDSASFRERPYFSFQEKSLQSSSSEKSEPGIVEFNPDFSQEPSWMKKKSLSSLSSSENLELPSKSPDSSENWLVGNNKSVSQISSFVDNTEKSSVSLREKEPNNQHVEGKNVTQVEFKQPAPCLTLQEIGETSELPSLYWKPQDESHIDVGQSHIESVLEPGAISHFHSYVAGHVESLSLGSDSSRRPSEVAASSQSSSSPASTIRENIDFPRCDSLISEPQLSSTREITDDFIDQSSCERRVHFLSDPQRAEVSHISMPAQNLQLGSLLEVSCKPNLCSTAMTPAAKASEHVMRILANLSQQGNITGDHDPEVQSSRSVTSRVNKASDVETTSRNLDLEWERIERELTQHEANGFSPESLLAVFSDTSLMTTPLLMNKIKEHVLRLNGRGMSSGLLPSESSGIGGSGFEITESRADSAFGLPSSNKSTNNFIRRSLLNNNDISSRTSSGKFNPPQHNPTELNHQPVFPLPIPSTPVDIDGNLMRNRHTLAAIPTRSDVDSEPQTPVERLGEFNNKDFCRITSAVIKKNAAPDVPKSSVGVAQVKTNFIESALHEPLVKVNKSQVYFGGARVRHTQIQSVVVLNSSFKQGLELDLRIKDSDDFYVMDENRSLVSRRKLQLEPRQECCLDLVFQPTSLGPLTTKLNLYPRCETTKNMKYTVDLFGYGGSSHIRRLAHNTTEPENTLVPKPKGSVWNCQLVLENRGNVAGFAFIQPLQENEKDLDPYQCLVMPQCCSVGVGDIKDIQIFIHPSGDGKVTSFKLRLVWGDEPLRARWLRCIANGAPVIPTTEINEIDWTRLLQLESNDNPLKPAVSEGDMALFFNNVTAEEITVIIPEHGKDSRFVTLAAEPATVLESSIVSDAMLPHHILQRRQTTATSGKCPSDVVVSAAVTELAFPSTKVGAVSSQKIPLQNWSGDKQEIRVKTISGPFVMKHARNAVPGGYFTRLPIEFHPTKSGLHSGRVVLDVGQNGQTLTISLKGDAY